MIIIDAPIHVIALKLPGIAKLYDKNEADMLLVPIASFYNFIQKVTI